MIILNQYEVSIDAIGKIVGCRRVDGKTQFKLKIDNEYIWVSEDRIKTLPTEEELK